ncbi:MAG: hypothetical protein IM537_17760 [Pseudanabaena sp. M57BS1SP1A06MG]|nr:hypothetical protein [Pseudanabaena sp. M53BS1SP1A06MG]MCA6583358.1 hypothetical protein [Pseudanabaena sp. M34BS1SP1A06MG]MCA6593870.1 hypothetical protein [Pseudanabaena sp. M38BS1SP1A06MG]MCA6601999.1 hypothetical protein [Pseudanabaena sp. M57BS1SP1A06MG]
MIISLYISQTLHTLIYTLFCIVKIFTSFFHKPDHLFPHQTAIVPHHPKPDRLFPHIKQRSHLTHTNPIAYSLK